MSFILDALKKSENERQRQLGPSLAHVQVRPRSGDKPWWVLAVAGLLVVNLAVLSIVLLRNNHAKPAVAAPPDITRQSIPQPPAGGTQVPLPASASRLPRDAATVGVEPDRVSHPLALEAGDPEAVWRTEDGPALAAAAVPEGPPLVRPVQAPVVAPLESPRFSGGGTAAQEILPTIHDIAASGTTLPQMHVDIHVYSANPAERFVFVNLQRYAEGQTLKEGPLIESIRPDGVVLHYQGRRFLLPRDTL